jgi:sulfur-carrier protein
MGPATDTSGEVETVTLRYWAAAKAAAGVAEDVVPVAGPVMLAELLERAVALHPDSRLHAVLGVCSVLVGDRPVGSRDAGSVQFGPGETVEFLPPFAGG